MTLVTKFTNYNKAKTIEDWMVKFFNPKYKVERSKNLYSLHIIGLSKNEHAEIANFQRKVLDGDV